MPPSGIDVVGAGQRLTFATSCPCGIEPTPRRMPASTLAVRTISPLLVCTRTAGRRRCRGRPRSSGCRMMSAGSPRKLSCALNLRALAARGEPAAGAARARPRRRRRKSRHCSSSSGGASFQPPMRSICCVDPRGGELERELDVALLLHLLEAAASVVRNRRASMRSSAPSSRVVVRHVVRHAADRRAA